MSQTSFWYHLIQVMIFEKTFSTSANWFDGVMIFHDMSPNVTMLNIKIKLASEWSLTEILSIRTKSSPWLCFSTCQEESLTKQWTYGPTLLPWFDHFHTSLACFTAL